jgi:hypothetical protein
MVRLVTAAICFSTAFFFNQTSWNFAFGQEEPTGRPTALKSNLINGDVEASGQSYLYTFSAGPGDVKLSVNGATDYYSSEVHVTVSDEKERQIADFTLLANEAGAKKTADIQLAHRQMLKMAVNLGTKIGVRLKYIITLSGAVSLQEGLRIADAGIKTAAPQDLATTTSYRQAEGFSVVKPDDGSEQVNNTPIEDKWALVIGISQYQHPNINLKYSAKDARDLWEYLTKEANFAPDHVKLLVNEQATKEHVLEEIGDKWLPRLARPNDLVLVFISCHGSPSQLDLEGLNYLVMYNTDPESLYATGLPLQDLASVIRQRVHADRVVVIIDACHSGAASPSKGLHRAGNFDSTALCQGTGQLVICSSKPDQVSWESLRYPNGVFTHRLIEALRSNSGRPRLADVFERMKESVLAEVLNDRKELQTPILKSKWSGDDLILSAPPSKPRPIPRD